LFCDVWFVVGFDEVDYFGLVVDVVFDVVE